MIKVYVKILQIIVNMKYSLCLSSRIFIGYERSFYDFADHRKNVFSFKTFITKMTSKIQILKNIHLFQNLKFSELIMAEYYPLPDLFCTGKV